MFSGLCLMRSGLRSPVANFASRGFRHLHCPGCGRRAAEGLRPLTLLKSASHNTRSAQVSGIMRFMQPFRKTTTSANVKAVKEIPTKSEKIVGMWLMGCAGMVAGAVVLGGVTRLTESGLSMVDWKLLKDMRPPQTEQEWEEEFARYKLFPEYTYVVSHREMTVSDFKYIYYMEYAHRMWGRAIGVAFALPALYFLKKGWISKSMKPRVAIYAGLIGFQGFMGWYMVKSGLTENKDVPRVSQYRLAAHLGTAIFLYSLLLYGGLSLLTRPSPMPITKQMTRLRIFSHVVLSGIVLSAITGAFVAGLDAGLTYNSWPKMADKWIPDDIGALQPKWKNMFENPTTVQFNHRHIAESTVVLICAFWWACRKVPLSRRAKIALNCVLGMAFVQASLGICTLIMYVPTHLAATHQTGSVVLLSFATWLAHEIKRMPK